MPYLTSVAIDYDDAYSKNGDSSKSACSIARYNGLATAIGTLHIQRAVR